MVIYGVALLSICMIAGLVLGELLGLLIGVEANLGGVGIAMLLLLLLADRLKGRFGLHAATQQGILFWSSIYIPVVVAMAATQNVVSAIRSGPLALLAGTLSVAACFALVPVLSRGGGAGPMDAPAPDNSPRDSRGEPSQAETNV